MTQHCCADMTRQLGSQCDQHTDRNACPDSVIGYSRRSLGYNLLIHDGEGGYATSGYAIAYCPWCGVRLPERLEIDLSEPFDD